ncbi:MAG: sulfite oxidase-like oxidoreductase [Methanobacteriota archaeon]
MKEIVSPDKLRKSRIPPGQKLSDRLPVLHYNRVPEFDLETWRFTITGLVEKERELNFKEFSSIPRIRLLADIHWVTTWSILDTVWEGVQTLEIKKLVKVKPEAKYVLVSCDDGYTTNLSLKDFFGEDVVFTFKYAGDEIAPEHGFPVRLVVPRLYFWKSAKWASGIEFMAEDKPGFWESGGYHNRGDPWKEERYAGD